MVFAGFNEVYKLLAEYLCNLEPNRTDTEYNVSLITKVFLFQFVNSYSSMYMVAFVKSNAESLGLDDWFGLCKCVDFKHIPGMGYTSDDDCTDKDLNSPAKCVCEQPDCIYELAYLLLSIFGTQLVIGNVLEFVVPWFQAKLKIAAEEQLMDDDDAPPLTQAEFESKLHPYERIEVFNDYNEMILQLGFITLFAPAFPMVALMGFVNNLIEIRSDANKLVRVYQRPQARAVEDIGTWETILEILTYISVATNVGLVWFTTSFGRQYSTSTQVWGFVVTEHVFLLIKVWIAWAIPDVPEDVKKRIQAQEYLTNKALGLEQEERYDQAKDEFFFPDREDNDVFATSDAADVEWDNKDARKASNHHEEPGGVNKTGVPMAQPKDNNTKKAPKEATRAQEAVTRARLPAASNSHAPY